MRAAHLAVVVAAVLVAVPATVREAAAERPKVKEHHAEGAPSRVQLGPRPYYLVDKMEESDLKRELQQCGSRSSFHQTDFPIGHRGGAPLQFPEHTKESHEGEAEAPRTAPGGIGRFDTAAQTYRLHTGCYGLWEGGLIRRGLFKPQ
jgi:glycerophosphoryl diester phosphodiesterase